MKILLERESLPLLAPAAVVEVACGKSRARGVRHEDNRENTHTQRRVIPYHSHTEELLYIVATIGNKVLAFIEGCPYLRVFFRHYYTEL